MAWTKHQILLAVMLVLTGSLNTISTKWADNTPSVGSDGQLRKFEHPFVQATCMFLGEFFCLLAFKCLYYHLRMKNDGSEDRHDLVKGNRMFNPLILFLPAMCDMIATSIMYVGLNLTYASSFQMLRGSVIIFVGILSVAFLNRNLGKREWIGIMLIIIGLAVVGLSDVSGNREGTSYSRNNIITGDLLIILAQVITAVQMVYEERYVAGLDIPALHAVGWEGFFGFVALGILLIPMYFIQVIPPFNKNAHGVLEDLPDALVQIKNNKQLVIAMMGTIISIAFFNFAGISVTKEISATTRMVLDSVRTLVIWLVSLALSWQQFHYMQIVGFCSLLCGMCLYNNIIIVPTYDRLRNTYFASSWDADSQNEVIINRRADEPDC